MLGFDHNEGKLLDMRTLLENLRSNVYTVFVSKHYNSFFLLGKDHNILHLQNKLELFFFMLHFRSNVTLLSLKNHKYLLNVVP